MNLYEINTEYLQIVEALEESGGELTPEIEKIMEENDSDFKSKVENYVKIIRNFEGHSNSLKEEIDRLKKLKKIKDNSIDRLKENLADGFKMRGEDRYDGGTYKISFRKSTKLKWDGETDAPDEYVVTEPKVLNAEIKKALKEGEEIPGYFLEENKNIWIR